jgi:hypothetical protein
MQQGRCIKKREFFSCRHFKHHFQERVEISRNNLARIAKRETHNDDTPGLDDDISRATDNHSGICSNDGTQIMVDNEDNGEMANPMGVVTSDDEEDLSQ